MGGVKKGKSSNKMEAFNGKIIDNNALDVPGTRFGFTRAWFSSLHYWEIPEDQLKKETAHEKSSRWISLVEYERIWSWNTVQKKESQTIYFYCLHALTVSGISSASAGTYNLPVQKQVWIEHVYYILHRKSNNYNYALKSLGISQILNGTVLLHDTYDVANPRIN